MIEIDGSQGEGGGQILRTAAAFSVHLGDPIHVTNIRADRSVPGLRAQHLTVLDALARITGGTLEGGHIGSREITFFPGPIQSGSYWFDIGTAGSIPLLFLTLTLALARTKERIDITAIGGTDVRWAPPWDHFQNVFLPLARMAGVEAEARLVRRGYFPAGGGKADLIIRPGLLRPFFLERKDQTSPSIEGIVNIAGLDENIAGRMRSSAVAPLMASRSRVSIKIDRAEADSPGVGIVLWSRTENSVLGASALGEKGIPAEKLGTSAAGSILADIGPGAAVDPNTADQVLPFMALARSGSSFTVREITDHAKTGIALVRLMLDREVRIGKEEELYRVRA